MASGAQSDAEFQRNLRGSEKRCRRRRRRQTSAHRRHSRRAREPLDDLGPQL